MQDRDEQSWRDAMALLGGYFTKEEHAAGWPEAFKPERIAILQRPYTLGDLPGKGLMEAFLQGLNAAVASRKLPNTIKTERVVIAREKRFQGFKRNRFTGATEEVFGFVPVYGDKDFHYISAPAFAARLAALREKPSPHIRAWFDAVGVAGAAVPDAPVTVANSAPPTPQAPARQNKRRDRKPSWATVAMPYMKELYKVGNYKSAVAFHKALLARADTADSPFTKVKGALYCPEAGTEVAEGSIGTKWPEIRNG